MPDTMVLRILLLACFVTAPVYAAQVSRSLEQGFGNRSQLGTTQIWPQKNGAFYAPVAIGTPFQRFLALISTTSDTIQVPCKDCPCGSQHQYFHSSESSSFDAGWQWHFTATECPLTPSKAKACNKCIHYDDSICFGDNCLREHAVKHNFACCSSYSDEFKEQEADGIIGLSRSPSSVLNDFVHHGMLDSQVFSLCLGRNSGSLTLGTLELERLAEIGIFSVQASLIWHSYTLDLRGVYVDGAYQSLEKKSVRAVVDSASSITYLPRELYSFVLDSFRQFCKVENNCRGLHTPPDTPRDDLVNSPACFQVPAAVRDVDLWLTTNFPHLGFHFHDREEPLCIPPTTYFVRRSDRTWCAALYPTDHTEVILGISVLRGFTVVFDAKQATVSWTKSHCDSEDSSTSLFSQDTCAAVLMARASNKSTNGTIWPPTVSTAIPSSQVTESPAWKRTVVPSSHPTSVIRDIVPDDESDSSTSHAITGVGITLVFAVVVGSFVYARRWRHQRQLRSRMPGNAYVNMTEMRDVVRSNADDLSTGQSQDPLLAPRTRIATEDEIT